MDSKTTNLRKMLENFDEDTAKKIRGMSAQSCHLRIDLFRIDRTGCGVVLHIYRQPWFLLLFSELA